MAARRGLPERAAAHARWAVRELVLAEVYPTLVLLAERLLHVLDLPDRSSPGTPKPPAPS